MSDSLTYVTICFLIASGSTHPVEGWENLSTALHRTKDRTAHIYRVHFLCLFCLAVDIFSCAFVSLGEIGSGKSQTLTQKYHLGQTLHEPIQVHNNDV